MDLSLFGGNVWIGGKARQVCCETPTLTVHIFLQGNAEAIAGRIQKNISDLVSCSCSLVNMKEYDKINLSIDRIVVAVSCPCTKKIP